MRFLFVGTNPGGGGTETHFVTLSRALAGEGHEVAAVVHPQGRIAAALRDSGVRLYGGVFRNSADLRGAAAVARAAREFRPDRLVGSFSKEYWPLALLSRATGTPLVLFRHMDLRLQPATRWLLSHWPLRLFAISAYLEGRLVAQGIPAERVGVLPNPLELSAFGFDEQARARLREDAGLPADAFAVGYVGAFHRGKGVFALADAIDAAHRIDPRVRGLWIGGGVHEQELRMRLRGRRWHRLVGWQEAVLPWYSAVDALALPSIEPDTFGRVCLEAQACGRPVLGTRMGGIPESFADGATGLLLPAGDTDAWRDAVLRLAADEALRTRLSAAGPAFASGFDAHAVACRFVEMIGR